MLPGFLHLELRSGLKACMINAAMSQLLTSFDDIREVFNSLGLEEISWEFVDDTQAGLKGRVIQFYINNNLINPANRKITRWNQTDHELNNINNKLLNSCWGNNYISFKQIKELFLRPNINLEIAGVCLEIIANLECDIFVDQKLTGHDALWLLCHLVMHAALLRALDPKFLSASKIYLGSHQQTNILNNLNNPTWLKYILQGLPVVESDEILDADVLAAAFIKTLVGQFGPRGDSVILSLGIGLSSSNAYTEALWCEASLPDTMSEIGPSNKARIKYLCEISGLVMPTTDMQALASTMSLHGAKSLSYNLVHAEKNSHAYMMRFLVNHERQKEALEAFLIKGNASQVISKAVETHELNKRLVSVPLGSGNKTDSYRFYEYIYYERCLRVEPLLEDLNLYAQKTNFSIDVARSDLLMAWKKWRGQIIGESYDQA